MGSRWAASAPAKTESSLNEGDTDFSPLPPENTPPCPGHIPEVSDPRVIVSFSSLEKQLVLLKPEPGAELRSKGPNNWAEGYKNPQLSGSHRRARCPPHRLRTQELVYYLLKTPTKKRIAILHREPTDGFEKGDTRARVSTHPPLSHPPQPPSMMGKKVVRGGDCCPPHLLKPESALL